MKLEDKKFLAKWLGWEIKEIESNFETLIVIKLNKGWIFLNHWNPDTNPDQFKEVATNLNYIQRQELDEVLKQDNPDGFDVLGEYLWVSNNLPKVCQAVIDVLREEG